MISRYLRRRVPSRYLLGVAVFCCLFAVSAYPLKVTVDGYTYLSSARSIFTSLSPTHYYWLREPGYPVFLRSVDILFGSSDLAVTLSQAFLLAGSLVLAAYVAFRDRDKLIPMWLLWLLPVVVVAPQFFGYSSMILKQPLIGVVIAVGAWFVMSCVSVQRARSVITLLLIGLVVAFVSPLIAFNLSYFWLWPAFVGSAILTTRKIRLVGYTSGRESEYKRLVVSGTLFVLLYTLGSFALSSVSESSWENYKAERSKESTLLVSWEYPTESVLYERLTDPLGAIKAIVDTTPELLMLVPNDNPGGLMENDFLTWIQIQQTWRCGAYDTYVNEPFTTLGSYVQPSCRSAWATELVRDLHPLGKKVYQLSSVALLVAPLIFVVRRRWRSLLFASVPLWFVFNYGFHGGFVVDRYGHPIAVLSYVTLLLVIQTLAVDTFRLSVWVRRRIFR